VTPATSVWCMEGTVAVVATVLLAYAVVERRLRPTPISGAMVFTAVGLLASDQGTGLISPPGCSGSGCR
jgi:sodium/hydrogen antiporter